MSARLRRVVSSADSGASAVEYGLLVAGIAALIVGIVFVFGSFVTSIFEETCSGIREEASGQMTLETCPGTP